MPDQPPSLDDRLTAIAMHLEILSGMHQDLTAKVDTLTTNVDSLTANVHSLTTNVARLSGDLDKLLVIATIQNERIKRLEDKSAA